MLSVRIGVTSIRRWVTWSADKRDIHTLICQDTTHAANKMTYNLANDDESFNKEMANDSLGWHIMQSPNKQTGFIFWPAVLWKSVSCVLVDLWPKVGTLSTGFFVDMLYQLSCSFSEKVPVETHLTLCTSPPNLTACNMIMTFVWHVQLINYYFSSVYKYISWILYLVLYFFLGGGRALILKKGQFGL